jgi:hypothetical protein
MSMQTNDTDRKPDITSRVLARFARGDDAEIRVSYDSRRAEDGGEIPWISIRRWYRPAGGELRPTRQGTTIRVREIGELILALEEARATREARR